MDEKQINELFILLSIVALCIAAVLITLFILFLKRKNSLLLEQKEAEKRFEEEIATSEIEIKEETFRNISWELHDNIGQLITLAKLQAQNDDSKERIGETLSKALTELRILSKLTNPEALKTIPFTEALQQEVDRFNRLNYLKASMKIIGEKRLIDVKAETVLFRILQEFFSNTIKHARAKSLNLIMTYCDKQLCIEVIDDGIGFDTTCLSSQGIGLENIKHRAKLIGASANMESGESRGTKLTLTYAYETL